MQRVHKRVSIGVFAVAACALLLLSASKASVQNQSANQADPIVGLWSAVLPSNSGNTLVTMTFNQGGTTIEYDTPGTNSFGSPGESLVQGIWKKTGSNLYVFKEQNFIFNSSGVLDLENISTCHLILSADGNSFTGNCDFVFFTCSVSQCPGAEFADFPGTITATRFQ
jgi:hypothetical protein